MEIEIKGQSLGEWEKWLANEVAKPNDLDEDIQFVLEAFLALVMEVKDK